MSAIVDISIFIRRENFTLSSAEHEKSFITSGPGAIMKFVLLIPRKSQITNSCKFFLAKHS